MRVDLRNAGFERGDLSFWEVGLGATLELETGEVYRGSYSGKVTTATAPNAASVTHSDMVAVEYGSIAAIATRIKMVAGDSVSIRARLLDADLNQIRVLNLKDISASGSWELLQSEYVVEKDVSYISFYLSITAGLGAAVEYIDSMYINILSLNDGVLGVIELCDLEDLTASGDTSADEHRMYGFRNYYAEVECTSLTGTNPTLDIEICETDQYDNERILGQFSQLSAAGDQRVGIAAPIGKGMYVKYTEGGTWTDCDFKVSVIGVR